MTERVVLPQVTVDALQWEDCPRSEFGVCEDGPACAKCDGSRRVLVADQWVPLPEPLTVECAPCEGGGCEHGCARFHGRCRHAYDGPDSHRIHSMCNGSGRVPLPKGIYDVGTRTYSQATNNAGVAVTFVPLAEGVRLRQVEWGNVHRAGKGWPHHIPFDLSRDGMWLYARSDLYDRLASSVDGGPPWGVLNIRRQP